MAWKIVYSPASSGNSIDAASASYSDVLAAYNAASDGYTINIPSGDVTWSSGITVSKYVKFVGRGAGRVEGSSTTSLAIGTGSKSFTIISGSTITGFTAGEVIVAHVRYNSAHTMTGTVTSWNGTTLVINVTSTTGSGTFAYWNFEMPASGSGLTKITTTGTAFTFNGNANGSQQLSGVYFSGGNPTIYLSASSGSIPIIHDCRWSNQTAGIEDTAHRGLVYRCYFDQGFNWDNATNNLVTSSAIKSKNASSTNSWSTSDTMGDRDTGGTGNFYIEDCFFTGHTTECTDFDDNSRTVWRHNVMDNSGLTSHGQDTSSQGNRHFEVYDNVFLFNDIGTASSNMNYCVYWRGGAGIVIDNTMPNITSGEWGAKTEVILTVQQLRRNAGPNACWNSGYPSPRQPGQGHNGSGYITEGCYVANNGSGVLGLEDYGPDECGGGPSVTTYLQSGRDYFSSTSGATTQIQTYAKYTYPHPLRPS